MTPHRVTDERLPDTTWILTTAAARLLQISATGVHHLVREGLLPCEVTLDGTRIFRLGLVRKVADRRELDRIRSRAARLRALRPRMIRANLHPRQLAFRFTVGGTAPDVRLHLVNRSDKGRKVA